MERVALLYASRDGQTLRIVERIAHCLRQRQVRVRILKLEPFDHWPLDSGELPVVCAPIRYGKHLPEARAFVSAFHSELQSQRSAMVSINLTARKPNRSTPANNPYLKRFLQANDWRPRIQAVFAGALEYERYPWWDRLLIRMIMRLTGGPIEGGQRYEFTDWTAVERFASQLADPLAGEAEAEEGVSP
ncbi:menaquinone-dependent protoporphyrinogen IX dehydrogenase [Aestuariirhabdus litorea]|uniref:Protoporphyrinogen IX dehydrogenase [quinone] n=1 Tax=Aestuariirhabdus litorea TaxID=2528527 RepID=A0A3P3VNY5_9GAMM|nr:menaquinone-dependent protoporphyrinogen IX dehydrogenase [Aestuariirhabdus litorea]RRJ84320.1 menaquinone-dependent protoporphyrinogen IX dehydrogenase [Aestuariirhabdus litorea]RWW97543.1 menaquinone-dependent protoporphyrinogen IX dehydrogenase [Endozoicomonadaceae bacterium GTF-13]